MPLYGQSFPLYAPANASASLPVYSFAAEPTLGFGRASSGAIGLYRAGALVAQFNLTVPSLDLFTGSLRLGGGQDTILISDASNVMAIRNGANAQTLRGYFSYTNTTNYERWALKTASGVVELAAETLGTGADNIDVLLTPAGTGNVRFGTYGAEVALVAGYITVKDAGGTLRKLAVIA